ncbi:hypothetical protein DTO166G4_7407 [Paecilomyces variotii]|nr:hypothetical protein DTO166G4_7407 [Paecilomyces variotii]KAJ9228069.1 hypothetical protein DTO166G5_8874 [Paecilomyces variotii]KAJ9352079.1 hypothetical protein DTO027B9_6011 [Paecilomyces variotii]
MPTVTSAPVAAFISISSKNARRALCAVALSEEYVSRTSNINADDKSLGISHDDYISTDNKRCPLSLSTLLLRLWMGYIRSRCYLSPGCSVRMKDHS